jgi:class 3 adenylate cyclase/predicted ATPase
MTFDEVLTQIIVMLQHQGRVSYEALKRRFELDDAYLEDLKTELIDAQRLAADEAGLSLVWAGPADRLAERFPALPPSSVPLPPVEAAERRQLTVLFCDLADASTLAQQLDPEALREVIRTYHTICAEVMQRFDGYIAQYLGDGIMVYFGYPRAHDEEAQRAVHAGLALLQALAPVQAQLAQEQGISLAVRLGLHTGMVVVGAVGGGRWQERLALGETPNIAARLQGLAAPNTILISADTFRLIEGAFLCQSLGAQTLRGVPAPLQVYQVLVAAGTQSRFDAAAIRGLTPLVGREPEIALLRARWSQAQSGRGQIVLLSGEAGIGKSRLVQEFKEHVAREPAIQITFRCSPNHTHSALAPAIAHLQRMLQADSDGASIPPLARLERLLAATRLPLPEVVPLFAALLSMPTPTHYPPLTLSPQRQKQKTMEALIAWLLIETERQPVLVVWEDVQWADPSSLELLSLTLDHTPMTRLLLLVTYRPEFIPPWAARPHLTPQILSRLSRDQVEVLAERVAGDKPLPPEVRQQIVAKTDGVPLFVEELTKAVLETGLLQEEPARYALNGPLPPLAIPDTLHDTLMARLDRFANVKSVAQLGATIGRDFAYDLLQAVAPWDEATMQYSLRQLVEAEILYQRGVLPHATYRFKHALIQDAAYQSLLRSTRQQYHQRIAQALEERFADTVASHPELLAHHYTEAGLITQAIVYWQRAGQLAQVNSAYVEALNYLRIGLGLLQTLPDTPERMQRELSLQLILGPVLVAIRGYASTDVEQTYARARMLCEQVGDIPDRLPVLRGLHRFYLVRAHFQTAYAFAEQCLQLAQQAQDPAHLLDAQFAVGESLFYLGDLDTAYTSLTQGLARYRAEGQQAPAFRVVQDLGVSYLVHIAWILWLRGWPQQALQQGIEALSLAQDLAHPFSLAYALNFMTMFQQLCGNVSATQAQAVATRTVSATHGFPIFEMLGGLMDGWSQAAQGDTEEGLAQLLRGWSNYQATGAALFRSYFLSLLAVTYRRVGKPEAGLRVLEEALAAEQTSGERFYSAELYRLKGELLLLTGATMRGAGISSDSVLLPHPVADEAEAHFHQALDLARQHQARSLELRAVTSLARLWQHQGKSAEARHLLVPVYHGFSEGFATADLLKARALLAQLTSR